MNLYQNGQEEVRRYGEKGIYRVCENRRPTRETTTTGNKKIVEEEEEKPTAC